jgi:hypothetical protein
VKYSLKTLVGTYMDASMGCHFDYRTLVDGQIVDADPDGFQIGVTQQAGNGSGSGDDGSSNGGDGGDGGTVLGRGRGTSAGGGTPAPGGGTGGGGSTGTPETGGAAATGNPSLDGVALERPVPNPFTTGMHMAYAVGAENERVEISVYDLAGRRMKTLASGIQSQGRHDVAWDGRDESGARVRRGMYFVHIRIGAQARQVRVTFVN